MTLVALSRCPLLPAAALVTAGVRRLRRRSPCCPESWTDPRTWPVLAGLADRGTGLVALVDGELAGFQAAIAHRRARRPLGVHAGHRPCDAPPDRRRPSCARDACYAELADRWVREACVEHVVTVLADDDGGARRLRPARVRPPRRGPRARPLAGRWRGRSPTGSRCAARIRPTPRRCSTSTAGWSGTSAPHPCSCRSRRPGARAPAPAAGGPGDGHLPGGPRRGPARRVPAHRPVGRRRRDHRPRPGTASITGAFTVRRPRRERRRERAPRRGRRVGARVRVRALRRGPRGGERGGEPVLGPSRDPGGALARPAAAARDGAPGVAS